MRLYSRYIIDQCQCTHLIHTPVNIFYYIPVYIIFYICYFVKFSSYIRALWYNLYFHFKKMTTHYDVVRGYEKSSLYLHYIQVERTEPLAVSTDTEDYGENIY